MDRPLQDRRSAVITLAAGVGGLLAGLHARPARADTALDVQILQTASSLEALAVATYELALGPGPEGIQGIQGLQGVQGLAPPTRDALAAFARETLRQHAGHRAAFQAQTAALDRNARVQDAPNAKFAHLLRDAGGAVTVEALLDRLATIEKVATDTYLTNLSAVQDPRAKALLAGVMGVEAQHLAALRVMAALLRGGTPQFVAVPFPARSMKDLPHTAGTAAVPDALHQIGGPELLAEPTSGAA